jgi:UDP-N-acetylmuramate dehydrogenase
VSRADDLDVLATRLGPSAIRDAPLGSRTTYRVGGTAALGVEPADEAGLLAVALALEGLGVPVLVLGNGSNLLVSDAGFAGLLVVLGAGFEELEMAGGEVTAGGALALPTLARRTASAGLTGLEWAVGVPGTVGGAVRMNAGGHGSDTVATLVAYRVVDLRTATVTDAPVERLGATYRHTSVAPSDVVVRATHRLTPGDPSAAKAAIDEIVRWRRANQPGGANAGSVFTNPDGDSAGRLIDACGLKGLRIGSAEVSPKHANFIQADKGGSADDVRRVMDRVRREVATATGVELATEVTMVGYDSRTGDVGYDSPTGDVGYDSRTGDVGYDSPTGDGRAP